MQRPRLAPAEPCPTKATAFYTRFDRSVAEWIKQTVNANRQTTAQQTHVVSKWPGTGAAVIHQVTSHPVLPAAGTNHPAASTPAAGPTARPKKSGGVATSASSVSVVLGSLLVFGVLSYV